MKKETVKSLREKAEDAIRGRKAGNRPQPSELPPSGLLHELQVHQFELEMQNEELQRSQGELEASRSSYYNLYEFAPVGYFTLDPKGMIAKVNLRGAELLGAERGNLLRRPFSWFVAAEQQTEFSQYRRQIAKGEGSRKRELKLLRKDRTPFDAYLESNPLQDAKGNLRSLQIAVLDMTERKRAEEALAKREQELRAKSADLEEMNVVLKVLLRKTEEDKIEMGKEALANVKNLVSIYIDKLKKTQLSVQQQEFVNLIEGNLNRVTSPFRHALDARLVNLTPRELEIAYLIKEGRSTKEISEILKISPRVIQFHRGNLRKKLGLAQNKPGIRSYLSSME
jgi:PAS domain S-box-containing protein